MESVKNTVGTPITYTKGYYTEVEAERMAQKLNAKVVYKKDHTKVFNKKLGDYVDDYPLAKYLIKNSAKIILYVQVKENLYAIIVEKGIRD